MDRMFLVSDAMKGLTLISCMACAGLAWAEEQARTGALEEQIAALASDEDLARFKASREKLAADPHRPLYHFSTPERFLNDPNGLCQWRGNYHMFYQLYPNDGRGVWHWGHAVSEDMVNWKDLPIALSPTIEKSCYSGQVLVEDDRVIAMYHGVGIGNMIATASDPLLLDWEKHPANPVIPHIDFDKVSGRPYRVFDPCIWKEEDGYYSLSGSYVEGTRGVFGNGKMAEHLFHSKDLAKWEYLGPMIEDSHWTEPGEDGAVPNFLPIGNGKHMLLFFSHGRAGQYLIGDYNREAHKFNPQSHGRMNYGPWVIGSLHAPSACIDDEGRFLGIFNVRENKTTREQVYEGKDTMHWYGIMTLPRHYWLDKKNTLRQVPLAAFEKLRFDHKQAGPITIPVNDEVVLKGIAGKAMEIDAVIQPGKAREFGLDVFRSPDGRERTRITVYMNSYERGLRHVGIDVSEASLHEDVASRPPEIGPFMSVDGEPIRLRVFIDRSIVEVFVNDVQCLTLRAYPTREDSRGISVFARGDDAELVSLDAWQMRSIWPELKGREGE